MGLSLLALWFAVRSRPSQLTTEESAVVGVWQTSPLEAGHRTLMTLTSARRCRIQDIVAEGGVRDRFQGVWSLRDGVLTVDTRSYLECLPGPLRRHGPGEVWTFAVKGDRMVFGPRGPRTILLERIERN